MVVNGPPPAIPAMAPNSLQRLRALNPLAQRDPALAALAQYLLPRAAGGDGHRAHQMTINGLTYPFVRNCHFAAVPDVPKDRRYDMYSSLHLIAEWDLIFFFQADPQDGTHDINSRRGIRGIYVSTSTPYRATIDVTQPVGAVHFTVYARCPNCGSAHAIFGIACSQCNTAYPAVVVDGKDRHYKVLSSRIRLEPLWQFARSVSDERIYADMTDQGMVWTGRHDNAMGQGKGSSIRHLLPEEVVKIARLLCIEPDQQLAPVGAAPLREPPTPLAHTNGLPIDDLLTKPRGAVAAEDQLYFLITKHLQNATSSLRNALQPLLPPATTWDHLEYAASTFPWGYTGGAADYVIVFRDAQGRSALFIIECKKGTTHDEAVLQASLYVERVLQTLFLSSPALANSTIGRPILVQPVVIASGIKTPRQAHTELALPQTYTMQRTLWGGSTFCAEVRQPIFLKYVPPNPPHVVGTEHFRSTMNFTFINAGGQRTRTIVWQPPGGAVGTKIESDHILNTSWQQARAAVGI